MSVDESLTKAERPRRRHLKAVARFALGLVLLVAVLRWLAPDWDQLGERVELDWRWALLGLAGTCVASVVTAARWRLLAEAMGGTRLPYVAYFYGLVVTRFLGQFTSTLAMDLVGRGLALRSAGSERGLGHAATQVVLERILDLVIPLLLLAWALALRDDRWPWIAAHPELSLVVLAGLFLALAVPLLGPGVALALRLYLGVRLRLSKRRRAQVQRSAETALDGVEDPSASATTLGPTVDRRLAARVALLSLLRFAAVVVQFWGIAGAVGLGIGWLEMTTATPIAQLAGMLGLTPGGLGILEAGWAGGLGWIGQDELAIGIFVLAQRLGVIGFFGLLSALSWPLAQRARTPETP